MKTIYLIVVIFVLAFTVSSKTIKKTIKLSNFYKQGPFIFMTRFHLAAGHAQLDISYLKQGDYASQSFNSKVAVGMVNQTSFLSFSKMQNCSQKQNLFYKKDKFYFRQEMQGTKHTKITDLYEEQIWYFYIYACNVDYEELKKNYQQIQFTFGVLNNGSHFGQNQKLLLGYIIIFVVWIVLVVKFSLPMANVLIYDSPNVLKLVVYGGLILLGTAYLYQLIHLVLYYQNGSGLPFFQILYLIFKNIGEAIITTMIVSISWGWSIIHMKPNQFYIIIGVMAGLINIVSLILSLLTEQHEELYHHYQTIPGLIVLILRFIIFLVFIGGIIQSLKDSSGRIIYFIRKLGLVGGAYLLCWPLTVLIVQLSLPNYMHRQVITFVEEFVHISACTILCHMISEPQSSYRKISLHEDDNPLRMEDYKNI